MRRQIIAISLPAGMSSERARWSPGTPSCFGARAPGGRNTRWPSSGRRRRGVGRLSCGCRFGLPCGA